jgi:hypothetical protein
MRTTCQGYFTGNQFVEKVSMHLGIGQAYRLLFSLIFESVYSVHCLCPVSLKNYSKHHEK